MGAVQVPVFQAMTLPDERQRLRRVESLAPGREVGTRIRVVHGVVQAHLDAAQGLGQVVETGQIDLGEVVDRDAGQAAHRTQRGRAGGFAAFRFEFTLAAHTLVGQVLRDVLLGQPVRLFDLDVVVSRNAVERHPVVARDRERDDFAVGSHVHEYQGVGVVAAVVGIAGVQLPQDRRRQVVAFLVFAGVQADQQDVHVVAAGARIFRASGPGKW